MNLSVYGARMGLFNRIKTSFRALFPRRYAWPGLDISLPGGQHLHLVGSIHMGTQDMSPLPPGLIKLLNAPTRWSSRRIFRARVTVCRA
jgi:uncharacterized protein YbaP (TraB family)